MKMQEDPGLFAHFLKPAYVSLFDQVQGNKTEEYERTPRAREAHRKYPTTEKDIFSLVSSSQNS